MANDYCIKDSLKDGENYYSLVIAISKDARNIVDMANELDEESPDDPIKQAVEDLNSGKYEIVYPTETV